MEQENVFKCLCALLAKLDFNYVEVEKIKLNITVKKKSKIMKI
jgi:hypothetical protein